MFSALAAFGERRTIVMLALGFSAGLPLFLVFDTLSAWLRQAGLTLEVIGYFSLATLAYAFKFLWAPLIDRSSIPVLTQWLGHRRSWMLVCQALIMLGLFLIAGSDPVSNLMLMAVFATFVGFSSATQDIVIDAWRIEAAELSKQGAMAAAYQWGYRIAIIVSGAVPLLLADAYSWEVSYLAMSALMVVGMLGVLGAPREAQHAIRPIHTEGIPRAPVQDGLEWAFRLAILLLGALLLGSGMTGNTTVLVGILSQVGLAEIAGPLAEAWKLVWIQFLGVLAGFVVVAIAARPFPGKRTRPGVYLAAALGEPLVDFFSRYRGTAELILALICLYRLSDFVLNIMNPFYLDLGFTLVEVAEVRKIFGVVASMLGVFAGGFAIARLGLMSSLVIGAFTGPISNLIFIWLAVRGHDVPALFVSISFDNFLQGFAGTCLIAYMSSLTTKGFTATQYAFFSSLYAIPGKLIASQSGRIVETTAQWAEAGGVFAPLRGLFANMPPETFATALERSGVSPASLAAGYTVFFIYSAVIGLFAIALSFAVAAREKVRTAALPQSPT